MLNLFSIILINFIYGEKYVVISKITTLLNCVTIEIESLQPTLDIEIELRRNIITELKKRSGKIEFLICFL